MAAPTILRPAATRTAAAGDELVEYASRMLLERLEIRTGEAWRLAEPARHAHPLYGGWLVVDTARHSSVLVDDDTELVAVIGRSRGTVLAVLHLPAAASDAA